MYVDSEVSVTNYARTILASFEFTKYYMARYQTAIDAAMLFSNKIKATQNVVWTSKGMKKVKFVTPFNHRLQLYSELYEAYKARDIQRELTILRELGVAKK